MKIALLGVNSGILKAALKLHELGVSVRIYASPVDTILLGVGAASEQMLKDYSDCQALGLVVFRQVTRVSKCFLAAGDELPGRSRFLDLFRISYLDSRKSSSEINLDQASQELKQLLEVPLERFEDFDIVIDGRRELLGPRPLGSADVDPINYNFLQSRDLIYQGEDFLLRYETSKKLPPAEAELSFEKEKLFPLMIIGDTAIAAECLIALKSSILEGAHIHLVTKEAEPFAEFKKHYGQHNLKKSLDQFFLELQENKKKGQDENFFFYCNHQVSCLDQMIDQDGYFVTLESPDFNSGKHRHRTIRAASLINAKTNQIQDQSVAGLELSWNRAKTDCLESNGSHPEIGYYTLLAIPDRPKETVEFETNLKSEKVLNHLLTLFRKA